MTPSIGNTLTKVLRADPESFTVTLRFRKGPKVEVALEHLFARPKGLAAEVVRGDLFGKCFVESGALAWPNGLELCADALFAWAAEQKRARSKAGGRSRAG